MALSVGANAAEQAIKFALCLAAGVVAGTAALLYLRKASFAERFLTDLFATLCLGGGFVVCVEFILGGKPELFGAIAYSLGAALLPTVVAKVKKVLRKRRKKG